jgi:hypothetical protein
MNENEALNLLAIVASLMNDGSLLGLIKSFLEILIYLFASVIGSLVRIMLLPKKKNKIKTAQFFIMIVISTTFLFLIGEVLRTNIKDDRLSFGVAILISIFLPYYLLLIKEKNSLNNMLSRIISLFFPKFGKALEIIETEERNEKKEIVPRVNIERRHDERRCGYDRRKEYEEWKQATELKKKTQNEVKNINDETIEEVDEG